MYINNINILFYIIIGFIGLGVGQLINLSNVKLSKHQKVFTKQLLHQMKEVEPNYLIIFINSALYMVLLYIIGIGNPIKLIGFLVLVPMLLSAFYIDYKLQIIPNRLTLTMFEVGLVYTFLEGITNLNVAFEMILGGIIGAGVFLILTVVGGFIFGKETMGYGDVKLMGALGLFFGWRAIIAIAIISFFIGAIYSIILMIILKIQKKDKIEYIAFGPFIVLATFIVLFVPLDILILLIFKIFTVGRFKG